jgi:hypothetical protein
MGIVAGILIAQCILPMMTRALPNDLARNRTILDALQHGRPQMVIFGDSRAEAGLDARQLSREMPGSPLVYNLATHSQTVAQAFLFHQQLPSSVSILIQFVTPENLGSSSPLDTHVFNSMFQYGYRPSEQTASILASCFGPSFGNSLRRSDLQQRFDGRWVVRQAVDSVVRSRLRRDLAFAREQNDLFFPSAYTRRIGAQNFALEIAKAKERGSARMTVPQRCVIDAMIEHAHAARWRVVFVLTPMHPDVRRPEIEKALAAEIRERGGELLDLSDALEDADFVDPLHASARGAAKITSRLAAALAAGR